MDGRLRKTKGPTALVKALSILMRKDILFHFESQKEHPISKQLSATDYHVVIPSCFKIFGLSIGN